MSPKLRYIEPLPQKPVYHMAQSGINFNPEWPIRVNVNHILGDEENLERMLCNEKYKGDFHLQKYYTPENKRNHTRKNNGEVQSYYISENHEPIVSPEVWEKVQEVREQRKRDRNIGQDSTMKFQNRYPLSGMLIALTAEKRSGADRFTRRKSNGSVAPTLKRVSRHAKGYGSMMQNCRD